MLLFSFFFLLLLIFLSLFLHRMIFFSFVSNSGLKKWRRKWCREKSVVSYFTIWVTGLFLSLSFLSLFFFLSFSLILVDLEFQRGRERNGEKETVREREREREDRNESTALSPTSFFIIESVQFYGSEKKMWTRETEIKKKEKEKREKKKKKERRENRDFSWWPNQLKKVSHPCFSSNDDDDEFHSSCFIALSLSLSFSLTLLDLDEEKKKSEKDRRTRKWEPQSLFILINWCRWRSIESREYVGKKEGEKRESWIEGEGEREGKSKRKRQRKSKRERERAMKQKEWNSSSSSSSSLEEKQGCEIFFKREGEKEEEKIIRERFEERWKCLNHVLIIHTGR